MDFIKGAFGPMLDGSVNSQQMSLILEAEVKAGEDAHHAPTSILAKTADGLPGFGIVAAVLGIVVTTGHISGPVEEIGHHVGAALAALIGTFVGILASYGFIAPLVVKLEFQGINETIFMRSIASSITAFMEEMPPKVAIEVARRGLLPDVRPSGEELEVIRRDSCLFDWATDGGRVHRAGGGLMHAEHGAGLGHGAGHRREHSAVVGATMNTAGQIGAVISPIVVAKSVEWFNDWNFPLLLLSGLFGIGAACWLFIDPRRAVFESGAEGVRTNP